MLFHIVRDADYIYCPALKLLGLACFIYCLNFLDTGCAFLPGTRRLLYQHSEGKKSTLLLCRMMNTVPVSTVNKLDTFTILILENVSGLNPSSSVPPLQIAPTKLITLLINTFFLLGHYSLSSYYSVCCYR
jgi:hypothetical protein